MPLAVRRLLLNLTLLAVSLGIGLLIVEFGGRMALCEPLGLFEPSSRLGYVMAANYNGCHKKFSEFDTLIETNSHGHRDRDYGARTAVPRVLVLGDSVTFGFGVEESETFAAQLEARLRHSPAPVEVINAGVWGYNLLQILRYVKAGADTYQPDVIVIGLTSPLMLVRNWGSHLTNSVTVEPLRNESAGLAGRLRDFGKRHSHVYSFLDRRWQYNRKLIPTLSDVRRLLGRGEPSGRNATGGAETGASVPALPDSLPPDFPSAEAIAFTVQLVEQIRASNDARGVKTIVALFPDFIQVFEAVQNPSPPTRSRQLNQGLIDALHARGIDVLDLTMPLAQRAEKETLYLPHDTTHLTAAGHQVAAEALLDKLTVDLQRPAADARPVAPAGR